MSIPVLVVLILNVLLAIFLLYGFLWGIGRGLKKSSIRFAYFIGFVIIAAIVAPFVSSAIAGIYIAPLNGTIEQYILTQIQSIPEIADLVASSDAMAELIAKLPVLFINIIVFVVLVYVSRIFSWIGYVITSKILAKKKKPVGKFGDKMYTVKDGQPVVLKKVEEKKYRWWGGLIGATQGLVLLFLTLLPITGIVGMASSYVNQTVSAQSTNTINAVATEPEYTELAKLLRENLPAEAIQVIDAYSGSVIAKIFSVGEFDLKCFDTLTTITLNGERVCLRNEVNSVGEVIENVLYVMNFAEEMQNAESTQSWEDLDFDKMKKAVEAMFDSGLVRSVGMDALTYYLDYATSEANPFDLPAEAIQMLVAIQTSLEGDIDAETADVLKSDILALLGVAQAVFESGIIDLVDSDTEPTPAQIIACLKGTDGEYKVVTDLFDSIFTSKTLKAALCEGINIGTSELAKEITAQITEDNNGVAPAEAVAFSQIQPELVSWTNVKNEIVTSIIKAIEIYEIVGDLDFDTADESTILALDYDKVITNVGAILNNLKNTSILKGIEDEVEIYNILNEVFENLNRINEIGTYFDLTVLADVDFVSEFAPIVDLIDIFKPALTSETVFDYSTLNYTTISTTIQTLLNSNFLEAIKTTVLDKVLESEIDGEMGATVEKIITNIKTDYANMSLASTELMNFVNIACVFGESGAFDLINSSTQEDIDAVIDSLIATKSNQTETQIARAIGFLFNSETTRIIFIDAVNESLASMEDVENELGRIDKDQNWAGWTTFSADLKDIVADLIAIYGHLGGTADMDTLLSNPTTLISNNNFEDIASRLGQILDKFATTELLDYTTGETTGSLYDDLLTKMLGEYSDYITLTDAKTDKYVANFWKTEFESIAPAIIRMNAVIVDGESENTVTMLEALINGGDFDSAIAQLSSADVDTILGALLDSSLFKGVAVEFVNMINESLIGIVQDDTSTVLAAATLETDLQAQKTQILNIVKALLPIMDFTSIDDLTLPANETVVEALLTTLKANYDSTGVFSTAYTTINNKIIEGINEVNESLFDVIGSIPSETLVPTGTYTLTIFDQFVVIANALKPLENAIDFTDVYTNYESSLVALLNTLQTNANAEDGIFGDAYGAIESYILNSAGTFTTNVNSVITAHPDFVVEGNYNWTAIFAALE